MPRAWAGHKGGTNRGVRWLAARGLFVLSITRGRGERRRPREDNQAQERVTEEPAVRRPEPLVWVLPSRRVH